MLKVGTQRLMAAADDDGKGGGTPKVERDPKKDYGDDFEAEAAEGLDASGESANDELDIAARGDAADDDAHSADGNESDSDDKRGDRGKGDAIPGKRAKEMMDKAAEKARRAMQAQLDELRAQLEATTRANRGTEYTPLQQLQLGKQRLSELRDQYEDEILSGKKDEAKVTRKQVNMLEDQLEDLKVQIAARASQTGAAESIRYQAALEVIEEKYPELNPEHDDYDKDKDDEVADLVDGLVAKGTAKDVALKRAVKYVLGERKKTKDGEDDPAMARTIEARRRAAAAAAKQPADGSRAGRGDDRSDSKADLLKKITPNTWKKFAELPENEKAKLRGDYN